jgi:RNA binding exosome subunit
LESKIQSVEISYLVHSTEDKKKLSRGVEEMLKMDVPWRTEELEGHYGNKIVRVSYRVTGESASSFFANLVSSLPEEAKKELSRDLERMMDEHSALYLRLDKQSLISGRLALGGADPIRLRVKPRLFLLKGGAAEFYRNALGVGR